MESIFLPAAQLGGTVFTVVAFLWYLGKRDTIFTNLVNKGYDAQIETSKSSTVLAVALQKLTDKIEKNSNMSITNTDKLEENIGATTKNTEAIKTNGK